MCIYIYLYTTEEVYQDVNESFCIIRSSFLMSIYIYTYIYIYIYIYIIYIIYIS